MFTKSSLFQKTSDSRTPRTSASRAGGTSMPAAVRSEAENAAKTSSLSATARAHSGAHSEDAGRTTSSVPAGGDGASRLIVGPEVKLKGAEILDCDTLVVEGRVEATMDSRVLRIATNGSYEGTVGIDVAEIHGAFEGELTARQQLIIHSTGRVSGKIRYGKILIEEGGEVSGDVQALGRAGTEQGGRSADSTIGGGKPLTAVAG